MESEHTYHDTYVFPSVHVPTIDLRENLQHSCLSMCDLQVPLYPGYQVVLERTLDQLVQDVG